MKLTKLFLIIPAAAAVLSAAPILTEGFDDISTLAGDGWVLTNNSTPGGSTGWFQGNPGVFPSQAGAPEAYIAANFLNTDMGGNISNWLIMPALTLINGDKLTFYTQSTGVFADRLEVRLNPTATTNVGGTDTSVGDFTNLLLTINPALGGSYPTSWTQFSVNLVGLAVPTEVRLAFRYFVEDTNINGDYIGIDTVSVAAIPEPGSFLLLGAGLGGLALVRLRR